MVWIPVSAALSFDDQARTRKNAKVFRPSCLKEHCSKKVETVRLVDRAIKFFGPKHPPLERINGAPRVFHVPRVRPAAPLVRYKCFEEKDLARSGQF
jgi:hypothetical protein